MSNLNEAKDNEAAIVDITVPGKAMERRFVSGIAVTFSSSFTAGILYEVANESNNSIMFFRMDGGSPTLSYGAGDSHTGGVPVMPFEKFVFRLTGSGTQTLRAIVSGSANITVYDHS